MARHNLAPRQVTTAVRCHSCLKDARFKADAVNVTATGATQMLMVEGRKRRHSEILCSHGHKWWSRHPDAAKLDRAKDYEQQAETGRVSVE